MIKNKRILITGGAGSIGSELVKQLCSDNDVYVIDNNETAFFSLYEELRLEGKPIRGQVGDICNIYTLEHVFNILKPEIIFHLAALKHVTPAEHNPLPVIETNLVATARLTQFSHRYNVEKFIFTSSDKAVDTTKIYGDTKRIGEKIVKNAGYIVVRFGNVLGSQGSVIPIWQKQLDEGKPLTITDAKMERYNMSIEDACRLLIEAAGVGESGVIMVMDMGERKSVLELAKEILSKRNTPDYPIRMIGIRPGETLTEELMTAEERGRAIKQGNFWIIK